ncbi:DUF3299 domain-containing protein [Ruegeria sp. HKCCD7318]|uniref:DUF3299 domain-containing protein n=1 Tax=Ruegeria sp. HKCCD7318 TaxID=2683014 RepID=UPI001490A203|nr:DUF3299 domain-containing protein [Ruegeria sp. HKCCD7318]NOE34888.1 DUF3299 domain-containing protein [Ruegeria sp. HKCCD7318]
MTRNVLALFACLSIITCLHTSFAETVQNTPESSVGRAPSGAPRINLDARAIDASAFLGVSGLSGTIRKHLAVSWKELLPPLTSLETPFASLSAPQLEAMRTHVRWQTSSAHERSDESFIAEHDTATALLAKHKIDVENLMRERRKIIAQNNTSGRGPNLHILGKTILIPGYIVPLTLEGGMVTEFLLVPVAGSCVHTPSPPPNQVIHVAYSKGVEFRSIFDAFWIEGELYAEERLSDVSFFDGAAIVVSNYSLDARAVIKFDG